MASPNMNLTIPVVGVTYGPDWALSINQCLSVIDQHNHAAGSGVQITPAGMNINVDLPFNSNSATNLKSVGFAAQIATLPNSTTLAIYSYNGNLYYNNSTGGAVQITNGANVAGTPGSISNLVPPAYVNYASNTFTFGSNATTAGAIDAGPITIRNLTPSSNGITIQPNSVLPLSYTLTLPSALPASTSVLLLDPIGNISTSGTAAALSVTTLNATTVNASLTNLTTALAIKNDNGVIEFRNTADAVQFATITGSSTGLSLNLPDIADNYTFQVNGVTKAVINNSGINAQYLYGNLPSSTLPAIPLTTISWGNTAYFISTGGGLSTYTLATGTVTTTQPGRIIIPNVLDNGITQSSGFVSVAFFATINGVNYGLNMPLLGGSVNFRTFYYAASAGTYNISVSARVQEISGSPPATGTLLAGSAQFVVLLG